jgi:hypothetical protein
MSTGDSFFKDSVTNVYVSVVLAVLLLLPVRKEPRIQ